MSEYKLLQQLEEQLLDSVMRKDRLWVEKLLADDFIEFGSSGCIYTKPAVIDGLQSELALKRGLRNFKAQTLAPDVILLTYIAMTYNDTGVENSSSLRSSIWKLIDGSWQLFFHQGTPIPDQVNLVEYDNKWLDLAVSEIGLIRKTCNFTWIKDIQHIGSTAILGLKAKPIIDIMIGVEDISQAQALIPYLESLGYVYWADNPKLDRMFLVKGMPPFGLQRTHHIHVFAMNCYEWQARLAFRDYLNSHPKARSDYQNLKLQLASEYLDDREAYTTAKADFVKTLVENIMNTNSQ